MNSEELKKRIDKALEIAFEFGQIDGSHHKAWVIDNYKSWIEKYMFDEQDPVEAIQNEDYFKWDIGIAP